MMKPVFLKFSWYVGGVLGFEIGMHSTDIPTIGRLGFLLAYVAILIPVIDIGLRKPPAVNVSVTQVDRESILVEQTSDEEK